jgi:hypothetical protein
VTLVDKPPEVQIPPAVPERPEKSSLPQIVGGSVLLLIGALWLLERTGAVDLNVTVVLALGTLVTGLALMLLARSGPHVGLIVFGTILGLITLATAAAPFEGFQGGVGDRTIVIDTVDELATDYNLSMGKLVIDLRQVDDFTAESSLSASVGTGDLVVRVPDGTQVAVDARVGAGQLDVFGTVTEGVGIERSFETPGYEPDAPGIDLDLAAFAGRVEVTDE